MSRIIFLLKEGYGALHCAGTLVFIVGYIDLDCLEIVSIQLSIFGS